MTISFANQRTLPQNNKIWGLVQRLKTYAHLDGEEVMRDLCLTISGQPSSKALSTEQADKVIEELESRVKRARQDALSKKEGDPVDPDAFHTRDQMNMMLCLFADLGWNSNAQQQGFYRRVLAHKREGAAIFPHTRGEMRKVTEALKAIYVRKHSVLEMQDKVRGLLSADSRGGSRTAPASGVPPPPPGTGCHSERSEESRRSALTPWETKFLKNLQEKLLLGRKPTPQMIRKLDEVWQKRYTRATKKNNEKQM